MAAPHVAGLAALLFPLMPDGNGDGRVNDEVRYRIEGTSDNIGVVGIGAGRINALAAVSLQPIPTGAITGAVGDTTTGEVIVGALVTDGTRTALTGGDGHYLITAVPPGNYSVTASATGYSPQTMPAQVTQGETPIIHFALTPSTSPPPPPPPPGTIRQEVIALRGDLIKLQGNGASALAHLEQVLQALEVA